LDFISSTIEVGTAATATSSAFFSGTGAGVGAGAFVSFCAPLLFWLLLLLFFCPLFW
jgi:hypothetical protein